MSNDYFCRQCILEKPTQGGVKRQVSWIPEKFAILGKYLKLDDPDTGKAEDGWRVSSVGGRKSHSEVNKRSQDHKRLPSIEKILNMRKQKATTNLMSRMEESVIIDAIWEHAKDHTRPMPSECDIQEFRRSHIIRNHDPHDVKGVEDVVKNIIINLVTDMMSDSSIKEGTIPATAMMLAIESCSPLTNFRNVWRLISLAYQWSSKADNTQNAWNNVGGNGFEIVLVDYYNHKLSKYGIRLVAVFNMKKNDRIKYLSQFGLPRMDRVDIVIEYLDGDKWKLMGCMFSKASIRERIRADFEASHAIRMKDFISIFATMDMSGELAKKKTKSQKVNYMKNGKYFNHCISFNSKTIPRELIHVVQFKPLSEPINNDGLAHILIEERNRRTNNVVGGKLIIPDRISLVADDKLKLIKDPSIEDCD